MKDYCVTNLTADQIENIKLKVGMVKSDHECDILNEAAEILAFRGFTYLSERVHEQARIKSD